MTHPPIDQSVVWVYTHDLEGSARFYGTLLGFSLVLAACRTYAHRRLMLES